MVRIICEVAGALPVDPHPVKKVDVALFVHDRIRVWVKLHVGQENVGDSGVCVPIFERPDIPVGAVGEVESSLPEKLPVSPESLERVVHSPVV